MKLRLRMFKFIVFLIAVTLMSGTALAGTIGQTNFDWTSTVFAGTSIGQTFTAEEASTIDSISLFFFDTTAGELGDLTIDVYRGEAVSGGGTFIDTRTFQLPASPFTTNEHSVDFNNSITLNQGETYSFLLTPTTSRWEVGVNPIEDIWGDPNGDYTGGQAIVNDSLDPDHDLAFNVSTTPVVPEPISSVLFVVGGSVLAGRRFMKKRIRRT